MQATVAAVAEDGSGSVVLDDGTPLTYPTAAFEASGLVRLRVGQRVRLVIEAGKVTLVTIGAGREAVSR